jgi:diguanylate cyclase (GGDEF)-like protein
MGSALEIEARLKRADGELRHVWARLTNRLDDQAVSGMVLNITDITERREFERQLSHQASHDSLTGLANRDLLRSRLERVAPEGRSAIRRVGLLYLDLDGFKQVNDTQGHDAGDQLLRHVAATMTAVMRPQDTVARLGGDEFAVLMENVSLKQAEGAAQRLLSALGSPITIGDRMVSLVVSLGIACVEKGGASDTILGDADLAMYFSKRGGKGEPRVFSPAMRIDLLDRLSLGEDLRKALASGAVAAHFQPVVDLKSGEIVGAEALARWEHPDRGWVGPNVFIPLAEEMGLVYRIDVLVLRQACALGRAMVDAGKERFRMAVNLSGSDLEQEDIVATVAAALAESGLPPANLELELTEGVAIAESGRAERVLHELKGLGVSLAIDDFGTGYSALARLRKLPFDRLKIDKAFVDEVGADREGPTLVEAILDMARVLGLEVVAEGVEKLDQASYLNERFCDFAQGYFFGRPVAAAEFAEQVRSNALPAAAAG